MKRIIITKILTICIVGMAFVSHHTWSEDSLLDLVVEMLGFVFLSVAAFGRTWASAFISGKKNKSLVTDGPFSIVRNPLYFYSFLGFIGAGLAFESVIIAILLALMFFVTHWPAILKEEKRLNRLFGDSFTDYKNTVPRFIPNFKLLEYPKSVSISPPTFSKALLEAALILIVFLIAHIVEWMQIHSVLPVVFKLF